MIVNLTCYTKLSDKYACNIHKAHAYELAEGTTISELLEISGISHREVKVAFVNGKSVDFGRALNDGDWIALLPVAEDI